MFNVGDIVVLYKTSIIYKPINEGFYKVSSIENNRISIDNIDNKFISSYPKGFINSKTGIGLYDSYTDNDSRSNRYNKIYYIIKHIDLKDKIKLCLV